MNAAQGKTPNDDLDTEALLKIGQLAKAVKETVPTIRHWTKEGLLEVAELTPSGYQLYAPDMVERCGQIQMLKMQRLSIAEIKKAPGAWDVAFLLFGLEVKRRIKRQPNVLA